MIEYKIGDIFKEDVAALVNSVNCVGIMGRGIALQFKTAFPENFKAYAEACKRDEVQPGRMFVFETGQLTNPRYIINFPTKRHWRGKSRIEDIEAGLHSLVQEISERSIRSIAFPPLGSGLGGLEWSSVRPLIDAAFGDLENLSTVVFEPGGGPADERANRSSAVPNMTPGRAVLVSLIHRYLGGHLDPFVTLLEVQKLMYFMQEVGEPLRLKFQKGHYGPYAGNLRHVLRPIEGHLITGYADGGDAPHNQVELVPGAIEDSSAFLENLGETRHRLERVSDLVEGFESPYGLELLATVHWVSVKEPSLPANEVISRIRKWNLKKWKFSDRQILLARNVLEDQGWLTAS